MAGITHSKVSAKSDGSDSSLVLPSDWNADHAVGDIGGTPAPVLSTTNAAGNATTYLRTNDQLALFDATAPSTQAVGDSADAGAASVAARRDHKHAMPAFATNAVVLGSSAAAGNATTLIHSNDTIAAFDTTVPSSPTSAGAVGTAAFAARRDHQHPNRVSTTSSRMEDEMFYPFANTTNQTLVGSLANGIAGTAAGIASPDMVSVPSHPGIVTFTTGSTSTGITNLSSNVSMISLGGGRARYGMWINLPVLGTSAQRFEVNCGFLDANVSASAVDGCFFTYKDIINSGAWQVTTVANSVSTATVTTTGVPVVAATWYLLECEVNAAGSSVTYTVNGANPVTHAANIPTGVGRETGFYAIVMAKTVGATASLAHLDAWYLELDFTTPR